MDVQLSIADLATLANHTYVGGASTTPPAGYELITSRPNTIAGYWVEVWRAPTGETVVAYRGTDPQGDFAKDLANDTQIMAGLIPNSRNYGDTLHIALIS